MGQFFERLYYRPNTHITVLPANHHKNLLSKDYLVLTSDKNHDFDQTVIPVALFEDKWHYINWSRSLWHFFLGGLADLFHHWDQEDITDLHHLNNSDNEEDPTNNQEDDSDTTDTKDEDPVADHTNQEIRNTPVPLEAQTPRKSPLELHPIAPLPPFMVQILSTQLAPTQVSTSQPSGTSGSRMAQPAAANPGPATPQDIQNSLWNALQQGPPAGGGGPGGPPGGGGGAGGAPGPGQPATQPPQAVIAPVADVKTMGQLPQVFYGDRMKADNFIEEVKGYLQLNHNIAGFNSPMKKVAFTLTLIKGEDTAGWTWDLGAWLDGLDPAIDNVPALWDQFILEFAKQFQDTQRENQVLRSRAYFSFSAYLPFFQITWYSTWPVTWPTTWPTTWPITWSSHLTFTKTPVPIVHLIGTPYCSPFLIVPLSIVLHHWPTFPSSLYPRIYL